MNSTYRFTSGRDWFNASEFKQNAGRHVNPQNTITALEIGCYEGLSTVFITDNLLHHPDSTLTCVDPFTSINDNDHASVLDRASTDVTVQESNFLFNISSCSHPAKIRFSRTVSDIFLKGHNTRYDLIYLDGNHTPDQIKKDIPNCFRCLKSSGILWMDDYRGGPEGAILTPHFDEALSLIRDPYEVIHMGYQIAIRSLT